MAFTQDFRTQRRNYNDGETRIGEKDRLWYDSSTNSIRIGDGETPGGVIVGGSGGGGDYVLPTASSTTKGGVKIGSNITITDGVISVAAPFSGSYTDLTNKPTIPSLTGYATETFVTTRGYLTSVGTISYNDLSNKPTLFSGSYTDLTNKPTIPSLSGYATESYVTSQGYITSSALTGYATETFVTTRGYLTSVGTISYNDLSNKPTLFDGAYASLSGKPTLFSGSYTDLSSKPTIYSSAYIGTTSLDFTRSSASQTLSGVSIDGSILWINSTPAPGDPFRTAISAASGSASISLTSGLPNLGSTVSWTFDTTKITFPDTTTQTTAWTGAAAAGTLTGNTLASGVTASSLTSVGTLASLTSSGLVRFNNAGVGGSYNAAGNSVNIGGVLGVASNIYANGNIDISAGSAYYIGGNTVLNGTTLGSNIVNSSLTSVGTLTSLSSGAITTTGTLALNASGGITTNQTTFPLVNTTATTVNFAGAATTLNIGASTGTTTINNNLSMASGKTIGTTASITSNAVTAFIAGTAAESGVALQMPHEGALRNLTNGLTNMYFDVSIGGSTNGQFQFRSSSSFTNVLTMSPTAFNINTNAVVTSRTPSFGRLPFNSAIDTELTIDDMRFRISNQGGIFPQVIGNGSSRNLAWTVVAARSGSAVTQAGSTGTIVASNAWTSLYTLGGMDSAGDTYTATLQDKAASRIYRVTFMRSDNGSTTGYNIIAERLL